MYCSVKPVGLHDKDQLYSYRSWRPVTVTVKVDLEDDLWAMDHGFWTQLHQINYKSGRGRRERGFFKMLFVTPQSNVPLQVITTQTEFLLVNTQTWHVQGRLPSTDWTSGLVKGQISTAKVP